MRERLGRIAARPVLVTAAVGVVFVALQMWWVADVRHLGAFNVDEEGGIAAALRFHRVADISNPMTLVKSVFGTWNGPLVPLLSMPGLLVGDRSASWAILVQPLLVVVAAIAVAGIVRRLANDGAAIVAGLVVMWMPISIISSRSYQYSTGVGTFLALAMWALVASDRGRRRWQMIGVGAAIAGMLLCRTMSIGFVPGVLVAMAIVVVRKRRAMINAGLTLVAALALAGPWTLYNLRNIAHYLYVNAFGERAHYWGSVGFSDRYDEHHRYLTQDFMMLVFPAVLALVLGASCFVAARWATGKGGWRGWWEENRELTALWVAVGFGFLALFSTSNSGYWFAYPLDVLLVAAVAATAGRAPTEARDRAPWWQAVIATALVLAIGTGMWRLSGDDWKGGLIALVVVTALVVAVARVPVLSLARRTGWKAPLAIVTALIALASFALSLEPNGAIGTGEYGSVVQRAFVSGHDTLQGGNIEADPRMESTDPDVRAAAAADWLRASTALAGDIDVLIREHGPMTQSIIGEIHLLNANTIGLTDEITRRGLAGIQVVNTLEPPDSELRESLTPHFQGRPRVIVLIEGRSIGFPDGRGWRRFRRLAEDEGWEVHRRIPLPDGGDVVVYTHPDSIDPG